MARMIFVNLPVADLDRSVAFYRAIGAEQNLQFTDKKIADAHSTSEVLICISADSRDGVDEITEKALAAGGREPRALQDYGFMYSRSFEDLDGHIWEPMFMDMEAASAAMAEPATA